MCLPLSNSITGDVKNRPSIAAIFNKSSRSMCSEVLISFLTQSNNWMNVNASNKHRRRASSEILTYLKLKQLILGFRKALLSGLYCLYLTCSSFISELWYLKQIKATKCDFLKGTLHFPGIRIRNIICKISSAIPERLGERVSMKICNRVGRKSA